MTREEKLRRIERIERELEALKDDVEVKYNPKKFYLYHGGLANKGWCYVLRETKTGEYIFRPFIDKEDAGWNGWHATGQSALDVPSSATLEVFDTEVELLEFMLKIKKGEV